MHAQLVALQSNLAAAPPAAEKRFAIILDAIRETLDDAIDAMGDDAAIQALQGLYDQYVAPIDIPWVPQMAETMVVDPACRWLIGAFVKRFHAAIHTP